MSVGAFTDRTQPPTTGEIALALGAQAGAWDEFVQSLRLSKGVREEFRFYGANYGWALRFRKSGKVLVSLYPGRDAFVAQVVLPESLVEPALAGPLSPAVRQAILAANPYAEGRWVFAPVGSAGDLEDVRRLLRLKLGRD